MTRLVLRRSMFGDWANAHSSRVFAAPGHGASRLFAEPSVFAETPRHTSLLAVIPILPRSRRTRAAYTLTSWESRRSEHARLHALRHSLRQVAERIFESC